MTRAARGLVPALAAWLASALPAQVPAGGAERLPADWAARDLEGKWVAYRARIDGARDKPRTTAAWVRLLGDANELELLEWIAVFEGWQLAGEELVRRDAPHVLRAAAWNLTSFDSHGSDGAAKALRARAALLLGWLERFPTARRGALAELAAQLERDGFRPGDAGAALPPLDPMQLLVPMLDAPAAVQELGARPVAEPKVRYVHQVLRALGGVLAHGHAEELVVTKVVALTRHEHATLRYHAFDTLARMPAQHVPFAALAAMARDARVTADRRRLATLAASSSSHPALLDLLVELALDPSHPGHDTALTRFGEVGDPVAAGSLRSVAAADGTHGRAVAMTLARLDQRAAEKAFEQGAGLRALLQRCAWLLVREDPRAAGVRTATLALLRASPAPQLRVALDELGRAPVASALRGGEAAAVEQRVHELVAELQPGK